MPINQVALFDLSTPAAANAKKSPMPPIGHLAVPQPSMFAEPETKTRPAKAEHVLMAGSGWRCLANHPLHLVGAALVCAICDTEPMPVRKPAPSVAKVVQSDDESQERGLLSGPRASKKKVKAAKTKKTAKRGRS